MGNVNATSQPALPTILPPPLPPLKPSSETANEKPKDEPSKNPGPLMELHKSFKEMVPQTFEGAKFMINRPLSSFFSVSHQVLLNKLDSGYNFGATFVEMDPNAKEPQYVLSTEVDPNFNMTGNMFYNLADNIKAKSQIQVKNNVLNVNEASLDYRGERFTANAVLVQPELLGLNGLVLGQIFYQVTPGLALGAEVIVQKFRPQPPVTALALATKYHISPESSVSVKVGNKGVNASYYTKRTENFQIGVEVETDLFQKESTATLAYQYDLPQAGMAFRGMVNSNGQVGGAMEKRLSPLPFNLALSGLLDHGKNNFQVGIGLSFGLP